MQGIRKGGHDRWALEAASDLNQDDMHNYNAWYYIVAN